MTTHKAIRDALEAATKNGWQTHVADNDHLRALLADLDAKTAEVEALRREPMTDDELWHLWNQHGTDDMNMREAKLFARDVEAHHHITQNEQSK